MDRERTERWRLKKGFTLIKSICGLGIEGGLGSGIPFNCIIKASTSECYSRLRIYVNSQGTATIPWCISIAFFSGRTDTINILRSNFSGNIIGGLSPRMRITSVGKASSLDADLRGKTRNVSGTLNFPIWYSQASRNFEPPGPGINENPEYSFARREIEIEIERERETGRNILCERRNSGGKNSSERKKWRKQDKFLVFSKETGETFFPFFASFYQKSLWKQHSQQQTKTSFIRLSSVAYHFPRLTSIISPCFLFKLTPSILPTFIFISFPR